MLIHLMTMLNLVSLLLSFSFFLCNFFVLVLRRDL